MILRRKNLLTITFLCALAVRAGFALSATGSAFLHFHQVPGLDMQTLLAMSQWRSGGAFPPVMVPQRILCFLLWLINGGTHRVWQIFLIQSLLGAAGAVLVADLTLAVYRRRLAALAVGIFYGSLGTLVLYEFSVLQESIQLFSVLLGFYALISARRKRFSPLYSALAGVFLALGAAGRPVALPLALAALPWSAVWLRRKKLPFSRLLPMVSGMAAVWIVLSALNFSFNGTFSPFYNVVSHTAVFHNAGKAAASAAGYRQVAAAALRQMPRLLLPVEIAENLNYYFVMWHLPLLRHLPGPGTLLPLFWLALAVRILWLKRLGRFGWILLPLLTLLPPLAARVPIGRYRLLLLPYMCMALPALTDWIGRKRLRLAAGLAIAVTAAAFGVSGAVFKIDRFRPGDCSAWALALEARDGRTSAESLDWWRKSYALSATGDTLLALSLRLYGAGNRDEAKWLLSGRLTSGDECYVPACYYLGAFAFEEGDGAAEDYLKRIGDLPGLSAKQQVRYCFMRAELCRKSGDSRLAADWYRRALEVKGGDEKLKEYISSKCGRSQ